MYKNMALCAEMLLVRGGIIHKRTCFTRQKHYVKHLCLQVFLLYLRYERGKKTCAQQKKRATRDI